jgi:hypothetical protein
MAGFVHMLPTDDPTADQGESRPQVRIGRIESALKARQRRKLGNWNRTRLLLVQTRDSFGLCFCSCFCLGYGGEDELEMSVPATYAADIGFTRLLGGSGVLLYIC